MYINFTHRFPFYRSGILYSWLHCVSASSWTIHEDHPKSSPTPESLTTSFELSLPLFDCLCKPHVLTEVTIIFLHLHKLWNAHLPAELAPLSFILRARTVPLRNLGACMSRESVNTADPSFKNVACLLLIHHIPFPACAYSWQCLDYHSGHWDSKSSYGEALWELDEGCCDDAFHLTRVKIRANTPSNASNSFMEVVRRNSTFGQPLCHQFWSG